MIIGVLIVATLFLAYANGANDAFKGVATLFGTGTTKYRPALLLAVASTFLGSVCAVLFAVALLEVFTGKGLVPDEVVSDPAFRSAVGLGAACAVLLATRLGLPISTTHALTGALVGGGLAAGAGLNGAALGSTFAVPLLVSPFLALAVTGTIYWVFRLVRLRLGVTEESTVSAELPSLPEDPGGSPAVAVARVAVEAEPGAQQIVEDAAARQGAQRVEIGSRAILDGCHYVSAAAVGFARGLNDTPKIAALLVGMAALSLPVGLVLVGVLMAIGGILQAKRVAHTMSLEITEMNPGQGLTANLVTAGLVIFASRFGVPVSTTHVSCGSLFGIGVVGGGGHWNTIGTIVLAWVVTLPCGALFAALGYALAS